MDTDSAISGSQRNLEKADEGAEKHSNGEERPCSPVATQLLAENPLGLGQDADVEASDPKRRKLDPPSPPTAHQQPPKSGAAYADEGDVGPDESAFLDGVAYLAELESELGEVKTTLTKKSPGGTYVPLKLFRRGNKISVTDVSAHQWCSAKLEYKYLHPHLKRTAQWQQLAEKGSAVQLKTKEMKQGTAVHLKKELEVHDIVEVEMVTEEDRWAVKLLTTYTQLATIKSGTLEREITVFGDPFSEGVTIHGVIDQLQYSPSTGELILLDYKTRYQKTMPSFKQKEGNAVQLMLYKCLLDDLTCGKTSFDTLQRHLHLEFSRPLSTGPVQYIQKCGLESLFGRPQEDGEENKTITFGEVAKYVSMLITGLGLPLVSSLCLQYEYQLTGEVIGVDEVDYREEWMREKVASALQFWLGRKAATGVDVEDAWKCRSCQFCDVCVWKKRRELENSPAAAVASCQ